MAGRSRPPRNRSTISAGCLFSLAALENDAAERDRLYDQAAAMLREMEAEAWMAGHSPADPPLLPMFY